MFDFVDDEILDIHNTYQPVRSLRLQAKPSVYTSVGRRAFGYSAPLIWNAIPLNIRNSPSVIIIIFIFRE